VHQASLAPGFVQCNIEPPGPKHPNEFVVVYEFLDRTALSNWLTSTDRTSRIGTEPELFAGLPREQILATRTSDQQAVTAVSSFRLRHGTPGTDFDAAFENLVREVETFEGFVQCQLLPAEEGLQEETIVVFSFESRRLLDTWLESAERERAMAQIDPLLERDRTTNVVGGFAGWFGEPGDSPVRTWKQAALVLGALYPTALFVGFVRDLILPDLPVLIATLIGNAGGVAILSWLLMPPLTRRLAGWLRR